MRTLREEGQCFKRWIFNCGDSGPSSSVKQGQEVSLAGMKLGGSARGPLIDEFLMNIMGMGFKEVFPTEFENFMGQFSSCGPAQQKLEKTNIGKVKAHARVQGSPLLEEF